MGVEAPTSPSSTATLSKFLHNQHSERIRLNGFDCPEKGQTFGKRATQVRSAIVIGKDVTLEETHGKDNYRYILPAVILPDGTNANHRLVKDCWCWWYRKYAPEDTVLEGPGHLREEKGRATARLRMRLQSLKVGEKLG
jgi:endonuclease YncB( thermonuclease family)